MISQIGLALVALVVLALVSACPPRGPQDPGGADPPRTGSVGDPSGDPGRGSAADERHDPGDGDEHHERGGGDQDTAVGDPIGDSGDAAAATSGESYERTLESIPHPRGGEDRPGLAGAGGCEGGARAIGERWKVACNTCTCEVSGEVTCTLIACMPDPGAR